METGWSNSQDWTNLTESSKEGYGSKRAILPMIKMIINNVFLLLLTCSGDRILVM
jgi:hypothetical protein